MFSTASHLETARWLTRTRWGVLAVLAGVVVGAGIFEVIDQTLYLLVVCAALAVGNWGSTRAVARLEPTTAVETVQRLLVVQFAADILALAVVIHLSGGADNPFAWLFALPVAISGMVLPRHLSLALVGLSVLSHGGTTVLEGLGALEHHSLRLGAHGNSGSGGEEAIWRSLGFQAAYLTSFAIVLVALALFVHALAQALRQTEARRAHQERVAISRARFAQMGTVAAGVAHTIRNPLHGIANSIDLVKQDLAGSDEEGAATLDAVQEAVDRIELITRRLLELGQESAASIEEVDPAELLVQARSMVEIGARERDVSIDLHCEPGETIPVDPRQVLEAVVSVIHNAVMASPAGSPVRVEARIGTVMPEVLIVRVEDQGPGILPEHLDRVFDPFFTTKEAGQGTGLGLSIARRATEGQGGSIVIETEVGAGTSVELRFVTGEWEAA